MAPLAAAAPVDPAWRFMTPEIVRQHAVLCEVDVEMGTRDEIDNRSENYEHVDFLARMVESACQNRKLSPLARDRE